MMKHIFILHTFLLIILSAPGSAQVCFERTYGNLDDDMGVSVHQTFQGGYIISGFTTNLITSDKDLYVLLVDQNGDTIWTRSIPFGDPWTIGYSIEETHDSGYVVVGVIGSFGFLIKFDLNGDTLWSKRYVANAYAETLMDVKQTADSGFILSGTQQVASFWDDAAVLIKTDRNGNLLWRKLYGDNGEYSGHGVEIASDNGFVVCGGYDTPDEGSGSCIFKTNDQGALSWMKKIVIGNSTLSLYRIKRTPDSGYILCGNFFPGPVILSGDMFLVKTNINGIVQWTKQIGWENDDRGFSVDVTPDGGFIACGSSEGFPTENKNLLLVRTDANGDTLWTRTFGGPYSDEGSSVSCTADGGFIVAGSTRSFGYGGSDVYLIKTDENGSITGERPSIDFRVMIFPNPNEGVFRIRSGRNILRIELVDSRGVMILKKAEIKNNETVVDIRDHSEGIYLLKLYTDSGFACKKIIVQNHDVVGY